MQTNHLAQYRYKDVWRHHTPWRLVEICNVSVITVWTVYLQYTACLLSVNTASNKFLFFCMLFWGKSLDYACSEQNTNGPKRDKNVLFEGTTHNCYCSPETDGTVINPFSTAHEMCRVKILRVQCGLICYLMLKCCVCHLVTFNSG
jgi:hypothetical protein